MKDVTTRALAAVVGLLVVGCSQGPLSPPPAGTSQRASSAPAVSTSRQATSDPPTASPSGQASTSAICSEVGGAWEQTAQTCSLAVTNAKNFTMKVTAKYPADLVDDAVAGPPLDAFLRKFFAGFANPDDLFSDGYADLDYRLYEHAPNVKSIVFHNNWFTGGAHPNDGIDTITVDFKQKKALALADLFCAGVDPLKALPPLARPYVERELASLGIQDDISRYEPGGSPPNNADEYQAWYLDGSDLVLVMPSSRVGPMGAGMVRPHVPLTALRTILREGGCTS